MSITSPSIYSIEAYSIEGSCQLQPHQTREGYFLLTGKTSFPGLSIMPTRIKSRHTRDTSFTHCPGQRPGSLDFMRKQGELAALPPPPALIQLKPQHSLTPETSAYNYHPHDNEPNLQATHAPSMTHKPSSTSPGNPHTLHTYHLPCVSYMMDTDATNH